MQSRGGVKWGGAGRREVGNGQTAEPPVAKHSAGREPPLRTELWETRDGPPTGPSLDTTLYPGGYYVIIVFTRKPSRSLYLKT